MNSLQALWSTRSRGSDAPRRKALLRTLLVAFAALTATAAFAGSKTQDALKGIGFSYPRLYAISKACNIEMPKNALRNIIHPIIVAGGDYQQARLRLDQLAEDEVNRTGSNCDDTLRNAHATALKNFEEDAKELSDAVIQEYVRQR